MKNVYLPAAAIGAIIPLMFFVAHFNAIGFGVMEFAAGVTANAAASGFTADLFISSFVFWAFMFHRHRYAHGPSPALFVVLNLGIGLSCTLPAYLYAMELGRKGKPEHATT